MAKGSYVLAFLPVSPLMWDIDVGVPPVQQSGQEAPIDSFVALHAT